MQTFQCTHCHAIWSERNEHSICPNCTTLRDRSISDEITITLTFLHQGEMWKAYLVTQGKKSQSIWSHKPTHKEIYKWIKPIMFPL